MLGGPGGGEAAAGPQAWMETQGRNGAGAFCHLVLETGLLASLANVCRKRLETLGKLNRLYIKLKFCAAVIMRRFPQACFNALWRQSVSLARES